MLLHIVSYLQRLEFFLVIYYYYFYFVVFAFVAFCFESFDIGCPFVFFHLLYENLVSPAQNKNLGQHSKLDILNSTIVLHIVMFILHFRPTHHLCSFEFNGWTWPTSFALHCPIHPW